MTDFAYTNAKVRLSKGLWNWEGSDIRALWARTGSSAKTEKDVTSLSAFSALLEHNGTNYSRIVVPNRTVNADNTNDLAQWDCDELVWLPIAPQIEDGTGPVEGIVLFEHLGADASNNPLFWIDSFGAAFNPGGTKQTIIIDPAGLTQLI